MIALDTNVLLRYLVRDDEAQAALADDVMSGLTASEPALITHMVLCEMWWALGAAYGSPREERAAIVEELLTVQGLVVEGADQVRAALDHVAQGADFADALIACHAAHVGCTATLTFDRRAARAAGMTLIDGSAGAPPLPR